MFWINRVMVAGGVSRTLSPMAIVMGKQPDQKKHCCILFGAYAQVHDTPKPSNSMTPYASGTISLEPEGYLQGGYKFLHLSTGRKVSQRLFTELPIPSEVLLRGEDLAEQAGVVEELSFWDRNNFINDKSGEENNSSDGGNSM
eukprot:15333324-Ditylum_brightwellii.AAC.1